MRPLHSIRRAARAFGFGLLIAAGAAAGQVLDSLIMPGELIKGHAKIEAECSNCHKRFDKDAQTKLCLACHKPVAADVAAKIGYHGRAPEMRGKECRDCHTDHKGREEKIAAFDTAKFDHRYTVFPLGGGHAKPELKCSSCHFIGKKYRETPLECVECHRKDDTHKGTLGPKCADCHSDVTWKEPRFDHGKTHFPLTGKHEKAKCKTCHEKTYKDTPKECNACHKKDDVHKGRYGPKCETCHDAKNWQNHFPHDTKTKFPLGGKHLSAKCDSCHKASLYGNPLPLKCNACHKAEDVHKGGLGEACEKCHNDRTWKTSKFDHDRDTKFRLLGKHKPAKCDVCHKPGRKEKLATTCISCHVADDKHKGILGAKCEICHGEKTWKEWKFDHDRDTKYPLKGKHKPVKCEGCHTNDAYKVKTPTACIACHKKDDAHKGQLGERCADCHAEKSWKEVPFDHSKSRFPLLGLHAKVTCKECHLQPTFKDAPRECVLCHAKADVHKEGLGPACQACHNARSWKSWDFDHAKKARYPLEGGHKKAKCVACHSLPTKDKVRAPTACLSCHRGDDAHSGAFGTQCDRCHGTDNWRSLKRGMGGVAVPRQPTGGG